MRRIKSFAIALLLILTSTSLWAQISVDAPNVVGLNEQFNITFTLSEKASSFEWNPSDDFQLVWGPQTGSSTSISIINGKHSKTSRYTYTYVLLPRANGNFTLPAAHAVVGGKEVYSKNIVIQVVNNGASSGHSASGSSQSSAGSSSSSGANIDRLSSAPRPERSADDIFMKLSLSRTSAVVGEPITATLKLYTRGNVAGFEDAHFPTFNGFWTQELESPQNIAFQRESVGDRIYNSAVLRKWVLIPQKSGAITIDPAELVCLLQQRISTGNSIFDGFFDDYQTIRKRILTESVTINVSSLPKGAPASFTGAVGSFKISATLNTDSLKVHDAASLMLNISGKGNVALIGAPKINFPPDSELYDVKTSDHMDAGSGGTSGSRSFEYPFIPRSYGDFEIEPVEFSYFDINSRRYVTLKTEPITYHVAKGSESDSVGGSKNVDIPITVRKDVKVLGDDIHYISTRLPELSGHAVFFVGSVWFWVLSALIVILAAFVGLMTAAVRRRRGDVVGTRTRAASKVARKRLAAAGRYLADNLYGAYYEELHKALLGYAADKFAMGSADLSKEAIASVFASASVPSDLTQAYVELLDQCEFARYAPSSDNQAMKESYEKAVEVISMIESKIKKGGSPVAKALIFVALTGFSSMGFAEKAAAADNAQAASGEGDYVNIQWNAAVEAYSAGDYATALSAFDSIADLGLSSPELYVNIANAHFKLGETGAAILYYERALKLDPSSKDARYNLGIANSKTVDKIEQLPEFFLKTWARNFCYLLPSNHWAVLFLVLLAFFCSLLLVFFLSRKKGWRITAFFSAIVVLLLSCMVLACSLVQKRDFESCDKAIVTKPVTAAKSSPSAASSADLFVLHEGTKVTLLDTVGSWSNIEIADGREAWVPSADITVI